jgi:hypothetical protein
MILLYTQIGDLNILINIETSMFQRFLGASHRATINGNKHLTRLGRFDHSTNMAPDTCKTKISANTLLGQPNGSLIGYLANIGAPGTRKHQNFIRFTKAFFFHFAPSSYPAPFPKAPQIAVEMKGF